ncbi:aspartate-semialdehyde dehydrogenase [Oceanispirochaeta sp.]|uniref:aspartate-semialdehyde dehydrogenase n=1 Tax=Oceanispirochaeta sp. TaxID=2035350 RepID=UPI002631D13A|nr:aspartate-semialdehyde dehydrogenase [Oceanispirochaeta sp.]MDA3956321.1 aspartate-semialdehyde dehydrogenase [Oceanispirochaeta sp.]
MKKVGIIGWRGMVGSVLMDRMMSEGDLAGKTLEPLLFSTSQAGQKAPDFGRELPALADAFDLKTLKEQDIILSCQGGSYTERIYPELKKSGWKGYWIDAASTLRMKEDSLIVLDPVNKDVIQKGLRSGIKTYVGGNCTVSLMLMALNGLFRENLIEWMTSMTYQAASGAGAMNMKELISQMDVLGNSATGLLNPSSAILELDKKITDTLRSDSFPKEQFGAPLAGSLIPWIDKAMDNGMTKEEWKGFAETNKILMNDPAIPIDGLCVRIGSMRCHSQALTIKMTRDIPLDEIEDIIKSSNDWVRFIPNNKEDSLAGLTPAAVSGGLTVPVGRVRKLNMGPDYLTAFTVGDQLLWGAAEPVRRMLKITLDHLEG